MLSKIKAKNSKRNSKDDSHRNSHVNESHHTPEINDVITSNDNERQPISDAKLHRRNPLTVRQEIQRFDDPIAETTLADVELNELPGLQNTEQWKRIAARIGQVSPPLSRQYYQTNISIIELQHGEMSQVLGSYRRPGRSENEQDTTVTPPTGLKTVRRKIIFGITIITIILMIIVAIIVAVILVRKPKQITTDYYFGSIHVQAVFDPVLSSSSSTLAMNYEREFCTLISTTLSDRKTKYAIFYSACDVIRFRNGSIIGDFVLGFTRYQNATRLNGFLERTILYEQLFGGTILSIVFNATTQISLNNTDYDTDYDQQNAAKSLATEEIVLIDRSDKQQSEVINTTTERAQTNSKDTTNPFTLSDISSLPVTTNQSKSFSERQNQTENDLHNNQSSYTNISLTTVVSHSHKSIQTTNSLNRIYFTQNTTSLD
ncbi:unnamed protein product [Adineta steineri]|uniref:SEA domain-containing protein n=2 Tax=Adineta steineri TaxID=433720 RepID=A0A814M0C8_9BILA|nr:unnamed protein product [Adineta steineri]CAF1322759.1 unnamed protein product [Adineta steineri]